MSNATATNYARRRLDAPLYATPRAVICTLFLGWMIGLGSGILAAAVAANNHAAFAAGVAWLVVVMFLARPVGTWWRRKAEVGA